MMHEWSQANTQMTPKSKTQTTLKQKQAHMDFILNKSLYQGPWYFPN